jgi:hypothetical protein
MRSKESGGVGVDLRHDLDLDDPAGGRRGRRLVFQPDFDGQGGRLRAVSTHQKRRPVVAYLKFTLTQY